MVTKPYEAVYRHIQEVQRRLGERTELAKLFAQCFPNTLETTTELLEDGTAFVFTGDIPALWLRDSSAQVDPYVALAADDAQLRALLRGLIARQALYLQIDPYANSFNREPNEHGHSQDRPRQGPWVWERKYELDSLCYPIRLCYRYWQATGDETVFTEEVQKMLYAIVKVMETEQRHEELSEYRFERLSPCPPSDTLPFEGRGTRTNFTGMIWSGFRPSDDACRFGYLIPANMFAVVVLGYLATIAREVYRDEALAKRAEKLREEVEFGIQTYGIVDHPHLTQHSQTDREPFGAQEKRQNATPSRPASALGQMDQETSKTSSDFTSGQIYAYETDGFGNYLLMDDANVPSLLSIPYLGYRPANDPLYLNTRRFILSEENPYYFSGKAARGVGSPHTPHRYIWPIALAMQGLTSTDRAEQDELLKVLASTTAGTNYMHEGFCADDPAQFTRPWFAWANSLFSAFVLQWLDGLE
jgi:meiotically up-regulated gene 157 (Mug157) protein